MKFASIIQFSLAVTALYLSATPCFAQDASINEIDNESLEIMKSNQTGQVVFDRLNRNFGTLTCNEKTASYWLRTYSKNSNGFRIHLQNALPLLDYVSREVERLNLPSEYALVPFIESHYNPAAKSKIGPSGLWQMITTTAKHNGVLISSNYDGRYSPVDSTQGALKYLSTLNNKFPNWQTALMAYNAGSTRVRNSLKTQGLTVVDAQKKLPKGLAPHTYAYVLKIKAIACLIAEPNRYRINLPNDFQFTPLHVVSKGKGFDNIAELSQTYQVSVQDLMTLNPSYKKQTSNNSAPGNFLVPYIPIEADISIYDQSN